MMRILTLTLLALVIPALASADAEGAQRFIEKNHDNVSKLLAKPSSPPRDEALTKALHAFLDYDAIAKASLGDEWASKSEAQRSEFTNLLKRLVERSYTSNMQRTLKFKVRFLGAEPAGDDFVVKTEARDTKNRRAPPVLIDYRVREIDGNYRVVDIITDGVSLVDNYRRQFTRTIKREGWASLIEKMNRRLESGDETD
ncbi:MAG: ABC transporter substrate-binding protein [Myxococcales bacterium]|jgi:phospholipid transport system substrate-binding protein|nr:ABC transporter substrate-binding protein [Myxococcales bacterium]